MDKQAIQNLIKELIEKTTIRVNQIFIIEDELALSNQGGPQNTWFAVEVNEPHFFVGREGEALFALNHLARRILENKINLEASLPSGSKASKLDNLNFLIDINGFQKKRVDNVRAVAHMMAERARYFKSNIEVDPMSAFERRVVHEFLSQATDLKTESIGEGPKRRVVIKYIGAI